MPHPQNKVLSQVSAADRPLLEECLTPFAAKIGNILYEADDVVDYVYFPITGMVSILTVMNDGTAVETATVGDEGAIGALAAVGSRTSHGRAAIQFDLTALRLKTQHFLQLYSDSDSFRKAVNIANDLLVGQFQQTAACNALHHIEARLARWLLQADDRAAHSAPMNLTQEYMAETLAVQRTTVNEVANTLRNEGLISYSRGKIAVLDRAGLERRACECYAALLERRARIAKN